MKGVTKWRDVLAINVWVNLHSRFNWLVSVLIAAVLSIQMTAPRWQQGGQSVVMTIVVLFVMFLAVMTAIALVSCVFIVLIASVNLFRRGAIGPRTFTISDQAFIEDDGRLVTTVPWGKIRSIDKTRRHIFVRIGRWKFLHLPARDFEHEYQFAQYYADLLRARHEGTQG
jgi:ABC-type multidrug transport system fused ATPase/permease subunit